MATIRRKYQRFEEIEGFISATSSVTITFFNSLSVLFTRVNHLFTWAKISEKSVRPNLWNEKVFYRYFLFFTVAQSILLSIFVQNFRAPYQGRLENNNVSLLKNCAANVFRLCKNIEMTCANICLLAQFPSMEKVYMQQCTFEFR